VLEKVRGWYTSVDPHLKWQAPVVDRQYLYTHLDLLLIVWRRIERPVSQAGYSQKEEEVYH